MRRTFLFLISMLFLVSGLTAQIQLKGQVLDAQENEPLAGAQVFLDGTTIGTVTDGEGYFELSVMTQINTSLVISYMGFESVEIAKPFEGLPDRIFLDEKQIGLDEVEVEGKTLFSRAYKMKMFKKFFLGETRAGTSCNILNEDDIHLVYVKDEKTFYAYSEVPIEIENKFLRYRIHWNLIEFQVVFKKEVTLLDEHADYISIMGTCAFEDLSPDDVMIKKRRDEVYRTSSARFFSLLANGQMEGSDFAVGWDRDGQLLSAGNLFTIMPVESHPHSKLVSIDIPSDPGIGISTNDKVNLAAMNSIHATNGPRRPVEQTDPMNETDEFDDSDSDFQVTLSIYNVKRSFLREKSGGTLTGSGFRQADYKQDYRNVTGMTILTDLFYVDAYGNTDLEKKLYLTGYMGKRRVGDLLPLNYIPDRKFEANRKKEVEGLTEDKIYVHDKEGKIVKEGDIVSDQKKKSVWDGK